MRTDLRAAQALLPGRRLEVLATLVSGERSTVRRIRATGDEPGVADITVVVKEFHAAGESWVRETAALECLTAVPVAPTLVAAGGEPPTVIVEDLSTGYSVADALLGHDAAGAADAVRRWAEAIAVLHVASRESRDAFRRALAAHEGDLPVTDSHMTLGIEDAARRLDAECAALGVPMPTGTLDALRELGHRLGSSGNAALTPSDTCPDNNVLVGDQLILLDYEGAQWRHIAWDVAYLFVPWPTCWCAWRMPAEVTDAAFAAYRRVAASAFPEVEHEQFVRDVEAAAVGWSLMSTMWFLGSIRAGDPPPNPQRPAPARLAMVLHRLARAERASAASPLDELAGRLAVELTARHGAASLELAPAFRPAAGQ